MEGESQELFGEEEEEEVSRSKKRAGELQREGVRPGDEVVVLVTHRAAPACCSIHGDGTTMHVCGCTSEVAPPLRCSPVGHPHPPPPPSTFARRHRGRGGGRRDSAAAESAPPVLCLMSRSPRVQPSSPARFLSVQPRPPTPPLPLGTLVPPSQGVGGGLCL